ncbi:MAG: indole-3-glycerol-phosphate synthase [Thaumarchaeota archaeon]|nr:indole-3-glycerol-phosphate synthase [Nitrososphaerota archaeon]
MMSGTLARLCENSRRALQEGIYDTGDAGERSDIRMSEALQTREIAIISEIKFASPSLGTIRDTQDPGEVATQMVQGGAVAISVLTQPYLFGGSPEYLAQVRKVVRVPILMKDIVVDAIQIEAARRLGADCILLIQAVFDAGHAHDMDGMIDTAHGYGMQVLAEVHDTHELESALATKCDIIGVNNRNLDTLEISLETTKRVLAGYADHRPAISESGIESSSDIAYLKGCGASAFLVGTGIMRHGNVKGGVRRLVES